MAFAELWSLEMLVAAFAGGAFSATVGALPSFSLAGLMVIVGELYKLGARTVGVETLPVDITGSMAFGVVLGPHVAFGGGAAALAYASKRGYLDTEFEYHQAKEVTRGLGSRPDVLAVGGAFGIIGYWTATTAATVGVPVDPVALGVVVSALAHRLAFGYSLIGAAPNRWFDMTPYERATTDGEPMADGGSTTVEPWLPYQYRWSHVLSLGVLVGVLGAYVAYLTASAFLVFGISVVVLFLLNADVAEIPHHATRQYGGPGTRRCTTDPVDPVARRNFRAPLDCAGSWGGIRAGRGVLRRGSSAGVLRSCRDTSGPAGGEYRRDLASDRSPGDERPSRVPGVGANTRIRNHHSPTYQTSNNGVDDISASVKPLVTAVASPFSRYCIDGANLAGQSVGDHSVI